MKREPRPEKMKSDDEAYVEEILKEEEPQPKKMSYADVVKGESRTDMKKMDRMNRKRRNEIQDLDEDDSDDEESYGIAVLIGSDIEDD